MYLIAEKLIVLWYGNGLASRRSIRNLDLRSKAERSVMGNVKDNGTVLISIIISIILVTVSVFFKYMRTQSIIRRYADHVLIIRTVGQHIDIVGTITLKSIFISVSFFIAICSESHHSTIGTP